MIQGHEEAHRFCIVIASECICFSNKLIRALHDLLATIKVSADI